MQWKNVLFNNYPEKRSENVLLGQSSGISGGKQKIKFANATNRGRLCLFSRNDDLMVMENVRFEFRQN